MSAFNGDLSSIPLNEIQRRLAVIGRPDHFTLVQAAALAMMAVGADLALDLGTAQGNSATVLGLVCPRVHTFDVVDCGVRDLPASVTQHLADVAIVDFAPLVQGAQRVVVFWDAHGFDIAEAVLGRLMPLIADRPHVVVCHDITDNRYSPAPGYGGRRLWRGMADFYAQPERFAYVNLGWAMSAVDQIIPILDFCHRNEIELRSLDDEFASLAPERQRALRLAIGDDALFHMAYFTMTETQPRNFPVLPQSN